MNEIQALMASDHRTTMQFFFSNLLDCVPSEVVYEEEIIYSASLLASYAQTSKHSGYYLPLLGNLQEIGDLFFRQNRLPTDWMFWQDAGAQLLVFTGYFRGQISEDFEIEKFEELGAHSFKKLSIGAPTEKKRWLFSRMHQNFPVWTRTFHLLHQQLFDNSDPRIIRFRQKAS